MSAGAQLRNHVGALLSLVYTTKGGARIPAVGALTGAFSPYFEGHRCWVFCIHGEAVRMSLGIL
jgi:hypothetical protein